jgi:tripartite-type tricarboxylate transporter receptor subunit TctC
MLSSSLSLVRPPAARGIAGWWLIAAALPLLIMSEPCGAQTYPTRRLTIVVPYTAGSGFDIVARTAGQKFSERTGQPVVIDNKAGASGAIGTESVANAAPDGYTLLQTGPPHTVSPSMAAVRYDPVADFTPLGNLATSGLALTVTQSFPATTLAEFLAQVRANPGKFNYSSPGTGTLQHLGMELFKQQLKLDVVHVPYRGAAPALTDLVSGQVQFTFLPVNSARPHVQSGKLRMLAVAGSRRSIFAPDVPTLAELGHPSVEFELWYAFFGPAKLPPPVVQVWERELAAIAAMPDVKESLEQQGLVPTYWDAQKTGAHVRSEVARWRDVVEKAGLQPK